MGKVKAGKSVWRWESRSREIGERDEGGKKNKKKNGKLHWHPLLLRKLNSLHPILGK